MIHIVKPEDCCGCSACKSICPKQVISMKPDSLGFLYPVVDVDKCVNCGLCDKVCAFNDHYDTSLNFPEPLSYGVRHKDIKEVETSRSGAAFIALSDLILDKGGVVYGAGYKEHFRVAHKRATTKLERDEFKGSKYVQSDMGDVFSQVKKDLESGLLVLFSGTGCQVAGLSSFIGKRNRDRLFLVDIVCHGVPSPYIWRDYLNYLERQQKKKVTAVNFRDKKRFGWTAHQESFEFEDSFVSSSVYTKLFYQHIMFRHSCGNCHFTNLKRPGDITIADFWGWEKDNPDFNSDDKGANLVLVNTEKGKKLFEDAQSELDIIGASREAYLQPNLQHPSVIHKKRELFEKDYIEKGFDYIYHHNYDKVPFVIRCLRKIKRTVKGLACKK